MPLTVQLWDQAIPGPRSEAGAVTFPEARITVRELIGGRVRSEVERFNESRPEAFRGLVEPGESEQILNGDRSRTAHPLDWEAQVAKACASFERNGFLVIVDGQQVTSLDDAVDLRPGSEVEFVKLTPLSGG